MKTNSPVPVPCLLIQYGATWENHFLNLVNWIKCYFFIPLHTKFILTITKTKYFVTQNWIDTNKWYLKWHFIQHYKWYIYIYIGLRLQKSFQRMKKAPFHIWSHYSDWDFSIFEYPPISDIYYTHYPFRESKRPALGHLCWTKFSCPLQFQDHMEPTIWLRSKRWLMLFVWKLVKIIIHWITEISLNRF